MKNFETIENCLIYANFIDKKITQRTIYNQIKNGNIIAKKHNNQLLIDKYSFKDYLNTKNTKQNKIQNKKEILKIRQENTNNKLYISLDWFQVTFYSKKSTHFTIEELQNIMTDLLNIKKEEISMINKGYNNYQKTLEYAGIMLMYGDDTYNHCNLQIKGSGCDILYKKLTDNKESWYTFLEKINKLKGKITRMDIAIDDYEPIFELEELEQKIINREIISKFKTFKYIKDDKINQNMGMTIYIGSNTSEMYYRFYKKGAEQEAKNEQKSVEYNRYEIILRDKKANSVLKKINTGMKLEQIAISLIHKNFNVYETIELKNYWAKWKNFILGSKEFSFDIPKEEKTLERKKSWLKSQVATVLEEVKIADELAKKQNLLSKDYDTIEDILSYSKFKNNNIDKEKQQAYIDKKIEIKLRTDITERKK